MAGIEFQASGGGLSQAAGDARYQLQASLPIVAVTSQFDKVNATLANITGLTANVGAGETWYFEAALHLTLSAIGGEKYAIGGTCTATSIVAEVVTTQNTSATMTPLPRITALASGVGNAAGDTVGFTMIKGTIVVNAAGTLTVQFAQNTASGTSSVLVGSVFKLQKIS